MRQIRRIIRIHQIDGYVVHCLFNNGESRIIDFMRLFADWNVKKRDIEYPLLTSQDQFQQVTLRDGTLVWQNIKKASSDEFGEEVLHSYDVDPLVVYEASEPDPERTINIGRLIKQTRNELGLTQNELANKSGTSKHYISRIENNKSGIELFTLIKIVEGGLGKKLLIDII